jgi:hypothetical protein
MKQAIKEVLCLIVWIIIQSRRGVPRSFRGLYRNAHGLYGAAPGLYGTAHGLCRSRRGVSIIKGNGAEQFVFETEVTLTRPAYQERKGQKPIAIPGEPLTLRLVISKVVEKESGKSHYGYLLTNVFGDVDTGKIALWYYDRWQIGSDFRLLKSGGRELEHRQLKSGLAILKRLLVVSMACSCC